MASTTGSRKPAITITRSDHEKLNRLAETRADKDPETANELLAELDRARVVEDRRIAENIVRMGSTLRFTMEGGEARTVTLVFPGDADIAKGRVSVLTPIGAALIGLSESQSINWIARDGRTHKLTVESVDPMDSAIPERARPALRTA